MATKKQTTLALIDSKIQPRVAIGGVIPKIKPVDHRDVSNAIVDCIDSRFLIAGAVAMSRNTSDDQRYTVVLPTSVATNNYVVLFSLHTNSNNHNAAANQVTIRNKSAGQFDVLMRVYPNNYPSAFSFEYALFNIEEL